MKRVVPLVLLLGVLSIFAACDDGDGVAPDTFSLTLEVLDADSAPVAGLQLSVAADLPFYQDKPSRAAVSIPFSLAEPCSTRLIIEDVTGAAVMTYDGEPLSAGRHLWQWNGRDDDQDHLDSGVYHARIKCYDPDTHELIFDDRTPMYMALIDPAREPVLETDAEGKIEITDKRLFPHLCGAENMPARDETGEITGTIEFTDSMRFGLHDPVQGGYMRFFRDVTGPGDLQLVWDPSRAETPAAPETVPVRTSPAAQTVPGEFSVGPAYPNPFN